jgi:beta-1,4-mannosyltransferase
MHRTLKIKAWPAYSRCYKNPYPCLLYKHFEANKAEVKEFHLKPFPLDTNFDVLHIHWPLVDLLNPSQPLLSWLKVFWVVCSLKFLKYKRILLVWTIHNVQPHEYHFPKLQSWFWPIFISNLDGYISLSENVAQQAQQRHPNLCNLPYRIIPHGHYRDCYPNVVGFSEARQYLKIPESTKAILYFGLIRPYKNVSHLIETFGETFHNQGNHCLIIAGKSGDQDLEKEIREKVSERPNIYLHIRFIRDDQIQYFFKSANLVVLPFKKVSNSGSAILALSYNCPVLVPALGSMEELQAQVGSEWVHTYSGNLDSRTLEEAVTWAGEKSRSSYASLEAIDWDSIGQETLNFFDELHQKSIGNDQ